MKTFEFKSQICTSRSQSERLLALGLKKETADCYLFEYDKEKYKVITESWLDLIVDKKYYSQYKDVCFPAWSLGRLIKLCGVIACDWLFRSDNYFKNMVSCIGWMISKECFNKNYIEDKK